MDNARRQQRDQEKDELLRAIGEFDFVFERVCRSLELGIMFMLDRARLKTQRRAHVVLAGATPTRLASLYAAIVAELAKLVGE